MSLNARKCSENVAACPQMFPRKEFITLLTERISFKAELKITK
jgi:hypothetical protein